MSTTLTKTNPTCSNIELIDANSCYGDSLPVINSNIANLTATLISLQNTINNWENIVNIFSLSSVQMLTTMFNLKLINNKFISPYSLLQSLSSQWNTQQFSVYYPTITGVDYWYGDGNEGNTKATNTLTPWLTASFPAENFVNGQIINVFVNLSYKNTFTFYYHGNLIEYCTPQYSTKTTLACNGCNFSDTRFAGCNHDAGGHHWCDNAYSYCYSSQTSNLVRYRCNGSVGKTYVWKTTDLPKNELQWSANKTTITLNNTIPYLIGVGQTIQIINAVNELNTLEPNLNGIWFVDSINNNNFTFKVKNSPITNGGTTNSTLTLITSPSSTKYHPISSSNLGNLFIDYKKTGYDTFTTRIIKYKFKKINSTWNIQL
jgi:hypothetical protein